MSINILKKHNLKIKYVLNIESSEKKKKIEYIKS